MDECSSAAEDVEETAGQEVLRLDRASQEWKYAPSTFTLDLPHLELLCIDLCFSGTHICLSCLLVGSTQLLLHGFPDSSIGSVSLTSKQNTVNCCHSICIAGDPTIASGLIISNPNS
jgi:hypothetical protein